MNKKTSLYIFIILACCIFTISFHHCESLEKDYRETSFYSISSLCYHLDCLTQEDLEDPLKESIVFSDAEVSDLWNDAAQTNAYLPAICKARDYYYKAKGVSDLPSPSNEFYGRSKFLLEKVWKKMDSKLLNDSSSNHILLRSLNYPHLQNNPAIDQSMAKMIEPYLLPLNHPAKKSLDTIFESSRAIKDEPSFKKAGFETLFYQNIHSFIRVAKHNALSGFLVKVYLDSESNERAKQGWKHLKNRCEGAACVRQLIKSKKIKNFIVPDKWLYVLPINQSPANKDQPVILVVSKMNIVSKDKTAEAWRTKATTKHLDELYCVLSHGLGSSGLVDNVPYTKEHLFTFLDTEQSKKTPNYDKPRHFFSNQMRIYWDKLVKTGGRGK